MNNIYTSPEAKLDPETRAQIRARLSRLAEEPVRGEGSGRQLSTLVSSHIFMPIAILLVLILGGGVSFAAEKAVPGDALYSIKTGVNENVRGAFTVGSESEANWEARLTERRLEEAGKLEAEGKLDADVEAKLASDVDTHFSKAEKEIADLEASGDTQDAADARVRLENALAVHQEMASGAKTDSASVAAVAVRNKSGAIAEVIARLQAKIDSDMQVAGQSSGDIKANVNAVENSNVNANLGAGSSASNSSSSSIKVNTDANLKVNLNSNVEEGGSMKSEGGTASNASVGASR